MHTLLALSSVLLVLVGGHLLLGSLRHVGDWSRRRELQLLVLAAPVASLGLGIVSLHHFAGRTCFLGAPPWDYTVGLVLPLGMGLVALGGLGVGLVRLTLLNRVVVRRGGLAGPDLQALTDRLSRRLGTPQPRVLLREHDGPLALTCGLLRPTLLLSSWMVKSLDRRELEAVVAHELGHVARRDYLVVWLATVLRDAFFFLPTSWRAYRQLQHEKELACDDLAIGATNRPLALASALAKVWHQALGGPATGTAMALAAAEPPVERRIHRLLASPQPIPGRPRPSMVALALGVSASVGLLSLQAANLAVILAPMGCGPASVLGQLL